MIKVSIIGAGRISEQYIKVLRSFKNVKIVGIISKSEKSSKIKSKKFNIPYFGNSVDRMMNEIKPNIVIVCVTPTQTMKVCLNLFKYNCISLIEKPLGLSLENSKKILLKAKTYKRKSFVALNRRYLNSTSLLLKKISNDKSKRIVNIFDQEDTDKAKKNGHSSLIIKKWMYANSIHLIDYFTFLCRGNIKSINNQKIKINNKQYFKSSTILFTSGDIGIYHAYWNRPSPWKISVSCNKSFFYMSPIEKLFEKNNKGQLINYKDSKYDKEYKPGFYFMVKNLLKVYKKQKNNLVSLEENIKTMDLIKRIYF
tara:strand:- start:242 stop:1174 length:933 start_codon:yes stop_codon:yes gene_type:complete